MNSPQLRQMKNLEKVKLKNNNKALTENTWYK